MVAQEKVYLEITEAHPIDKVIEFQTEIIIKNLPAYYALVDGAVVGWADVQRLEAPRRSHRGNLGMGLLPEVRRRGIGSALLQAVIEHSKRIGIEKVELTVYTSNLAGIALYKKFGFEQEGLIRQYRRVDGQNFDGLLMAKFL